MSGRLEFRIDPKIFPELLEIQRKLPREATGTSKKDAADSYDHPAGLALLGVKDGKLDTVIKLGMSGGCWDAPNINHDDMDKGFRKMIELDRIVSGMCLMRHNTWSPDWPNQYGLMPSHLKREIHQMRNSFADITQTVWLILHKGHFRIYRPAKDAAGRMQITEMQSNYLLEDAMEDKFVKEKIARDEEAKALKDKRKKEREERLKLEAEARAAREERRRLAEAERKKKRKK